MYLDRLPRLFGHQPLGNRLGSMTAPNTLSRHIRAATMRDIRTQQFDLLKKLWLHLKALRMPSHLLLEWAQ
jgi:hypothetical protein